MIKNKAFTDLINRHQAIIMSAKAVTLTAENSAVATAAQEIAEAAKASLFELCEIILPPATGGTPPKSICTPVSPSVSPQKKENRHDRH